MIFFIKNKEISLILINKNSEKAKALNKTNKRKKFIIKIRLLN